MYYDEFQKLGIDAPMRNSGNIKVVCPKCKERKHSNIRDKDLSINFSTGAYKCHSTKCGWSGYAKQSEYSRPKFNNRTLIPDSKVKWFERRGISQKTLQKANITTDERGSIQFNYFRNSNLINIKTRFEVNGKKSFRQHTGAEKIVYNFDSLKGKKKCIFVEGEMDVLSWIEAGVSNEYAIVSVDQGAPPPESNIGAKLDCLSNCATDLDKVEKFYLCTDKDAPGEYLQQELIRRFGEHRCYVVSLPKSAKDANDVITRGKDNIYPHETNLATLRQFLKDAEPVPIPGIHTLDAENERVLDDFFENGRPSAETTHYKEFDSTFRFLKGEITAFTGIPGHGKSQFARQLMALKSHFAGWKWACYVPEDFPFDYFAEDIIKCFIGKNIDKGYKDRMTREEFELGKQFIKEHFFCVYPEANPETGQIDLPTNDWINNKIRFMKLKYGVNAYIKDPWNKIFHDFGSREDQYLAKEFSKEKFFASGFDAGLYVAHPKTMPKNKDGSYPIPTAYDISGGSMWYNQFDNIITVFRPNAWHDKTCKIVEVHSQKIKKQRIVAKPGDCEFVFDVKGARYIETLGDYHPMNDKSLGKGKSESFDSDWYETPDVYNATIKTSQVTERLDDDGFPSAEDIFGAE